MKDRGLSPARSRAAEVLRAVLEKGEPATPALAANSAGLTREDADLMREIVLGVLRNRDLLDRELAAVCRAPLGRLAPTLREILEVALYQIRRLGRVPDYAAVDEAVRHARRSAGEKGSRLVNAVLRNALRHPFSPGSYGQSPADLALNFSHPRFLVERWVDRFGGDATRRVLEADNEHSPLDLLVNPRKTTPEELVRALESEGVEAERSPFVPLALTVRAGNPLASQLLRQGHFSVQDVGSQALALLLPPGETLVDLAAAPGGKSFAALALGRARRAVCLDRSPARLLRLAEARVRLGVPEALPVAGEVIRPPLPERRFDRVLFDAPCSGTGTLRKNPDIRYRITPEAIERLARAQEEGLAAASTLLAPGGYLLYSTCSLELEENERVVQRVLSRNPDIALTPIEAPEPIRPYTFGARFQMLPGPENDGFTAHLLRRNA